MYHLLVIVIAYLIGSIPSSVILTRLILKDDIRNYGSGNPGASNVTRTYGLRLGAITLLCDALKGVLGTLIGYWVAGDAAQYYCAIAVVAGHNWPVFLKFKGGKGVATSFGVFLIFLPWWSLLALLLFLVTTALTRYFSVGSLVSILFLWGTVLFGYMNDPALFFTATILGMMAIARHWENIKRLRAGTENRL